MERKGEFPKLFLYYEIQKFESLTQFHSQRLLGVFYINLSLPNDCACIIPCFLLVCTEASIQFLIVLLIIAERQLGTSNICSLQMVSSQGSINSLREKMKKIPGLKSFGGVYLSLCQ